MIPMAIANVITYYALRSSINRTNLIQQGGLTTSRWTPDHNELTTFDWVDLITLLHANVVECPHVVLPAHQLKHLAHVLTLNHRLLVLKVTRLQVVDAISNRH
jgi:hypothetical protein